MSHDDVSQRPMITCAACAAQFRSVWRNVVEFDDDLTQGYGCACSVYQKDDKWRVQGFYGSRLHDMSVYEVIGKYDHVIPPTKPMDPVCDVCVGVWLNACAIVLVEGEAAW